MWFSNMAEGREVHSCTPYVRRYDRAIGGYDSQDVKLGVSWPVQTCTVLSLHS
jgi:hypothetical protein